MKTQKLVSRISFVLIATSLLLSSIAWAGAGGNPEPVTVKDGSAAFGTLLGARKGAGEQYIGCSHFGHFAICGARDAEGNTVTCRTSKEDHLEALKAMTSYGRLSFAANEQGDCTLMVAESSSAFLP